MNYFRSLLALGPISPGAYWPYWPWGLLALGPIGPGTGPKVIQSLRAFRRAGQRFVDRLVVGLVGRWVGWLAGWLLACWLAGWLVCPNLVSRAIFAHNPHTSKTGRNARQFFFEDLCLRERRYLGQCMVTFVCVCFFSSLSVIFDDFW